MLFLFILLAALVLQLFLHWWIIGVVAFGICLFKAKSGGQAFRHSFTAIFLLWALVALYHTLQNKNILATRVGEMFMLNFTNNWIVLVLITALLGGLVAGFAGIAGYFSQAAFMKPVKRAA
ncbi:MAG TPA: hypothetical protein VGD90_05330 [Sphingobacteriaceae bacterium]